MDFHQSIQIVQVNKIRSYATLTTNAMCTKESKGMHNVIVLFLYNFGDEIKYLTGFKILFRDTYLKRSF